MAPRFAIKSAVRWLAVAVLCVAAGACVSSASSPAPTHAPTTAPTHVPTHVPTTAPTTYPATTPTVGQIGLGVGNSTDLAISLSVNSILIETLPPRTSDWAIPLASLPPTPWVVEARTSTGRLLLTLTLGWTEWPTQADGTWSGRVVELDLSCGLVRIWTGSRQPSGPVPGTGAPGDCLP